MMIGPLRVEAVGDGINNTIADMLSIEPWIPLGKGTVMNFVRAKLTAEAHCVLLLPSRRRESTEIPMVLMSMKILRPACARLAQ